MKSQTVSGMRSKSQKRLRAFQYALCVGVSTVFLFVSPQIFSQDKPVDDVVDEPIELERIAVTGTRIKRVDVEGSTPLTIITREQIEAAGDSTIAELLRSSTYNSFGSHRDRSGMTQGFSAASFINLRGLGAKRTLVLLNGRRMSRAPGAGADATDINLIPMDMVERVEILRDGASAIYGSDAIAGVVNIITRKDSSGATLTIQLENPDPPGGEAQRYSVAGGVSGDRGNVTFSLEHFEREPIFERDIPRFADITAFGGVTSYGFPGSGLVLGGPLSWLNFADPRCPNSIGDSDLFPNSFGWDLHDWLPGADGVFSARCGYNYAADVMYIPKAERNSIWLDASFDVTGNTRFVSHALFTRNEGESRFAGTPVTFPFPIYAADNPNNPLLLFIGQTIADPGLGGSYTFTEDDLADVLVYMRTVPNGTRDTFSTATTSVLFAGFEGENGWFGGTEWGFGFEYSRSRNDDRYKNLVNKVEIQNFIDSGELDYFNVQGLDHDTWLSNTVNTFKRSNHMGTYQGSTEVIALDGTLGFDLVQMESGPVPAVVGFEYYEMTFEQEFDPESNSGIIAGGASGVDIVEKHGRDVLTFFAEAVLPLGPTLELNLAARHDNYSDFGGTTNPKVSVAWRPTDNWLLRTSYGTGFRAPNMHDLWDQESDVIGRVWDDVGCANGVAPCDRMVEVHIRTRRNPDLQPEESESWTAGAVWNVTDDLALELTWYDIEYTNHIYFTGPGDMIWLESLGLPNSVVRKPDGTIDHVTQTMWNLSGTRTSGVDFIAQYSLVTEQAGLFNFNLEWTHVLEWENEIVEGQGFDSGLDYLGTPRDRGTFSLNWTLGDFQAGWVTHYIGENGTAENWCWPSNSERPCPDGDELMVNEANWVHDLQLAWNAPWNGQIAIGARNLFNTDPPYLPCCAKPQNAWIFGSQTIVYEAQGRILYLRYKQDF